MKNKRTLAALLAASALTFTACGGQSAQNIEETTTTAASGTENSADETEAEETVFSLEEIVTDEALEMSRLNEGNMTRLAKLGKKLEAGEEVTVAYLGGSITQGSSAGDDLCYARLTTNWFEQTYPDATINYVRAGIGATGSYIGVHRADTDVLAYNPDVVFIDFSVNDTVENTERNKDSYESLLRKVWGCESAPAIVCIGMTMDDGTSFQDYHCEIAKKYDVPYISYKNVILDVIDKGIIEWKDISDDDIHPNVEGHSVLSALLTGYLEYAFANGDPNGTESDFSVESADVYEGASLIRPSDAEPGLEGFTADSNAFGNMYGYWTIRSGNGDFGGAYLKFEVEAQNIGVLFGKLVGRGGKFEVKIDGELVTTVDSNFPNGWGNYVECIELARYDQLGKHTVEIVPVNADNGAVINITAIAVS